MESADSNDSVRNCFNSFRFSSKAREEYEINKNITMASSQSGSNNSFVFRNPCIAFLLYVATFFPQVASGGGFNRLNSIVAHGPPTTMDYPNTAPASAVSIAPAFIVSDQASAKLDLFGRNWKKWKLDNITYVSSMHFING